MDTRKMDELILKLFRFKKEVAFNDITLYLRVVSDAVLEDARQHGLLESRKLRRDLRNHDSDAYLIYLDAIDELDTEQLVNGNINLAMRDIMQEYMAMTPLEQLPALTDNPSLEEQEDYEAAKKERETNYLNDMQTYVDSWKEGYEKSLRAMKRERLLQEFKLKRVDDVCRDLFVKEYESYVLSSAVFVDAEYKVRAFKNVTDFKQAPTDFRDFISREYNNLTVSSDDLKG